MKKFLIALNIVIWTFVGYQASAFAGGEMKEVCETQKDKKTGKSKEVCKKIKVHKKVEGTKVPETTKKK